MTFDPSLSLFFLLGNGAHGAGGGEGRKLGSAAVRAVMRGTITLTGERIHSSNYVAPTNFCPWANLRNFRRRVRARGDLSREGGGRREGRRGSRVTADRFAGSRVSRSQAVPDTSTHLSVIWAEYTRTSRQVHIRRDCTVLYTVAREKLEIK